MADYKAMYQQKLGTAAEAAQLVESGWVIGSDAGSAQPDGFLMAVSARAQAGELEGVKVHTMLDSYPYPFYADESLFGKIMGVSWFSSGGARKAVNGGFGDLIPAYYRDMPKAIRANYDYDAYVVSVSPMDSHGYFSLATTSSFSEAMIDKAARIIVEVNDQQPRALCNTQIHVSQVVAIVENSHPLPVLKPPVIDDVSRRIGELIAEQIPDGACIQLGIGAIPDATGMALKTKKDLGIHTEMFTDSMVELLECGAVNNSKKQIHRGKTVTTFAFGSQRIYDFINDNPCMEILPVDYVNDPNVICQNDNMISINAALEVDLFGQVCAESVGPVEEQVLVDAAHDKAQVGLRFKRRFQRVVDLVEGGARRGELHRVRAEEGVQLAGAEVCGKGRSGNDGVVFKMLGDAVVLTALIVDGVEIAVGIRRVVVEKGVDCRRNGACSRKEDERERKKPSQPMLCFHGRLP